MLEFYTRLHALRAFKAAILSFFFFFFKGATKANIKEQQNEVTLLLSLQLDVHLETHQQ